MDIVKLKSAEEYINKYKYYVDIPKDGVLQSIKEAQRNAIEYALQTASQNAEVTTKFISTGDYSGHDRIQVDKKSILNLKETIFKNNNL